MVVQDEKKKIVEEKKETELITNIEKENKIDKNKEMKQKSKSKKNIRNNSKPKMKQNTEIVETTNKQTAKEGIKNKNEIKNNENGKTLNNTKNINNKIKKRKATNINEKENKNSEKRNETKEIENNATQNLKEGEIKDIENDTTKGIKNNEPNEIKKEIRDIENDTTKEIKSDEPNETEKEIRDIENDTTKEIKNNELKTENKNFEEKNEIVNIENSKNNEDVENTEKSKINKKEEKALEKKDNKLEVKKTKNKNENKKNILLYIGIIAGILLLILVMVFIVFSVRNYIKNDVISNGIYIYGIDVSNMSRAEAITVLSQTFEEVLDQNIVLVSDEDYETYIEASEIDLEYDISSAVNYAYQIGKNGNLFTDNYEILNTMINGINIMPTYSIDEEKLAAILEEISADLPNAVVEGSYYIEDTTLVITKGTDGYAVNVDETLEKIKESIENVDYLENSITLVLSEQSPEEIDLDAIYEEVYQEATDAYYTTDPYAVYPSSTGLDFSISLDEAKELLEESETECEIELTVLYPSVTTNDIEGDAFPDLLASYTTTYDTSNTNRVTNLKLAASKIDGTVLLSGDTFSYNQVVGERTIAAGYKEAGIYVNGEVTNGLGGGICQISTTLFNAALLANLEMVEVHNHQMIPSYSSAGRDATVVYGTKDFQFSNSRNYAIKIECSVSGGVVSFKIYGVKEETEYDVSISAKITSQTSSYIKSKTYRILKLNGETVSTEFIYSCTYKVSS